MCHRTGRGVRRGSAKRAPLLNPCLPARAGGEPPQWENPADKGVVRPAAEGEDTAPQDVQHFHVAVGDQWSPNGQARSAWPNKGRGRLACPNPPCVSIAAPARGSRYSERGRGGSVPQLPQAAPGCPQALLSPWHAASALSPVCRGARSDLQDRHEQNPQPPVTRELIMTTLLTRGSRGADRDFVLFVSNAYEHVMRSVVLLAERCREVFDTRCSATGFTPVWEQF